MKTLGTEKSKRVVTAKIIELGLVHDKKQLLRKRKAGRTKGRRNQDESDEENEAYSDTDERGKYCYVCGLNNESLFFYIRKYNILAFAFIMK